MKKRVIKNAMKISVLAAIIFMSDEHMRNKITGKLAIAKTFVKNELKKVSKW